MMQDYPNSIARPLYLDRIAPFIDKNLIKVFTGQRRVGKSHLMFQLIRLIKEQDDKANIIYINKEDLTFRNLRNAEDLNGYVLHQKVEGRKNYVFDLGIL